MSFLEAAGFSSKESFSPAGEGWWYLGAGAQAQLLYLQPVHWLSLSPVIGSSQKHMWPKPVSSFPPLYNRHVAFSLI